MKCMAWSYPNMVATQRMRLHFVVFKAESFCCACMCTTVFCVVHLCLWHESFWSFCFAFVTVAEWYYGIIIIIELLSLIVIFLSRILPSEFSQVKKSLLRLIVAPVSSLKLNPLFSQDCFYFFQGCPHTHEMSCLWAASHRVTMWFWLFKVQTQLNVMVSSFRMIRQENWLNKKHRVRR